MTGLHPMMSHKPSAAAPPSFVAAGNPNSGFSIAATPLVATLPSFITNDLGILIGCAQNANLNNTPSGWSLKLDNGHARLWTRTLQAGDSNPGITAASNGARGVRAYVFRGVVTQAVEDSQIKNVNGNDSAPTNGMGMNTCDPITANALIFQALMTVDQITSWTVDAGSGGSGFTEIHRVNSTFAHAASYRIPSAAGSYTPHNWTVSGNAPPYPVRSGLTIVLSS
jgi:hypothetical protein